MSSLARPPHFCPRGNDTPIGNRVSIDGSEVAGLYLFQPLYPFENNAWDLALAKFDSPTYVTGSMATCQNGTTYPYPQRFSTNVLLGDGEKYYKVGARSPTCREGRLVGVGSFNVEYSAGQSLYFINQLIFSKMSDAGDSGSIIVRKSDNTVTGLNFAGGPTDTNANPIFRIGWDYLGQFKDRNGSELPVFTRGTSQYMPMQESLLSASAPMIVQRFDDPIPGFSAGKFFIGTRLAYIFNTGQIYEFIEPEIPPIRSDVPVTYIPICPNPVNNREFYDGGGEMPNTRTRIWITLAFG